MRSALFLVLLVGAMPILAQSPQPLETPSSPFDFDNYRRTPLQARKTQTSLSSKENRDLQQGLISGERGRTQDIATRAAALFPDPEEIPIRQEPEPLPTPNELTDEITERNYGRTTKGQRDLLARGRVADELNLSAMSESDYELYVAERRAEQGQAPAATGEALLRPMPTLTNTKTGGPPHAYAVSQAGVGARSEPRNGQNPFEDLVRVLRLDQPVTKGTDPMPAPSGRLAVASTTPVVPSAPTAAEAAAPSADAGDAKP